MSPLLGVGIAISCFVCAIIAAAREELKDPEDKHLSDDEGGVSMRKKRPSRSPPRGAESRKAVFSQASLVEYESKKKGRSTSESARLPFAHGYV